MKKIKLSGELQEYSSQSELSSQDKKLIALAGKATKSAYAPYSGFKVGAAVLLQNGKIISGSNQENVAFPSGLCAERVAIFSAGAQFANTKIIAIAITYQATHLASPSKPLSFKERGSGQEGVEGEEKESCPITPCGSCRQVIAEYEKKQGEKIRILMSAPGGKVLSADGIENLLPVVFEHPGLKK